MTTNQRNLFWEPQYKVSINGDITRHYKNGKIHYIQPIINKEGYEYVNISKKTMEKPKTVAVHRLVAMTYLPNENNFTDVHHIDANRSNNNIENLEWCSHLQNILYKPIISSCNERNIHKYSRSGSYIIEFWRNGCLLYTSPSPRDS